MHTHCTSALGRDKYAHSHKISALFLRVTGRALKITTLGVDPNKILSLFFSRSAKGAQISQSSTLSSNFTREIVKTSVYE
jgi:hypothetical protein